MPGHIQFWEICGTQYEPHPALPYIRHGERQEPYSLAYFSPDEGEIWARRIVLRPDETVTPWAVATISRTRPTVPSYPPASILCPWLSETEVDQLPNAVLVREFLMWYECWSKRLDSSGAPQYDNNPT